MFTMFLIYVLAFLVGVAAFYKISLYLYTGHEDKNKK